MTTPEDPRELGQLLHDAVDGYQPTDRLHAIRARTTRSQESTRTSSPRRWVVAVAGAAVAVAAVVAGAATLSGNDQPDRPPVAASPSGPATTPTSDPTPGDPTDSPSPSEGVPMAETTVPVYYVTDTAKVGPRLVREFHRVTGDPLVRALALVTSGTPADDAYRTLFPGGDFSGVTISAGKILVEMGDDSWAAPIAGMDQREAGLAVQQVVYTLQGVLHARNPVEFRLGGQPTTIFGVDTTGGVSNASPLETLNHVNITAPEQGATVTGERLEVTGVASSFEANVVCSLVVGGQELVTRPFTAEGWMQDRLFPFEGYLPLTNAGTGDAVVRCSTDDPSGGTEGFGRFTDDKLITIR